MDTDKLINELKNQLVELLGNEYKELKPELEQDINDFLKSSREKLERWLLLLNTSSINREEFEWLLKSQRDLIVLQALQAAGISKIKLNSVKKNFLKIVIQVVVKAAVLTFKK